MKHEHHPYTHLLKLQAFDRATINDNPETERLLKSSVNEDNIEKIDSISKNAEIEWFCTPMYPGAVKMLDPFVRKFKIRELDARPFSKNNSSELIDSVLDTKKPVIVSSQIPIMIKTTSNIQYLYCIPKYPCKMEEIEFEKLKKSVATTKNVEKIKKILFEKLKKRFFVVPKYIWHITLF